MATGEGEVERSHPGVDRFKSTMEHISEGKYGNYGTSGPTGIQYIAF
jgi:hypothetical protein